MDDSLAILFEPLKMNNLKLKNRFFMAPMGTTFNITRLTDYFVTRAKGEVGLITTGEISIHPGGRTMGAAGEKTELRLESDVDIQPLVGLVKEVHNAGAKIVAQLNHAGRYSPGKSLGRQSVAPSPIASRYTGETPRELSTQEADDLVIAFAQAALRARKVGFDGIELLGSSGYLISQFLSPLTNKRKDKYGGNTLQRATFLLSILQEIRRMTGDDFNICVKFDAEDGMVGGRTLEDSLLLASRIVEAGADRLHIWAGWHEASRPMLPMFVPRGAFSHLAGAIKKVVKVPVSTVGRINDPYVAAAILKKGEADLIGLGRQLLCDAEFVKKTMEGRTGRIRRCIACCHCFDQIMRFAQKGEDVALECALSPELGHEGEGLVDTTLQNKQVMVIGGGPAGMEVARVAALRGHHVTLFEKTEKLGGLVNLAFTPPHKEELKNIVDYYSCELEVLGVDVKLGEPFTPEKLKERHPDALVLASGAEELIPPLPGIEGGHVVSALNVLEGAAIVGESVVVIGGGLIGIETAEFLADAGKKVSVIEMLNSVADDIGPTMRWGVLSRIKKKMKIYTSTKVIKVTDRGVVVLAQDGVAKEITAHTIVVAVGLKARAEVKKLLDQAHIEYYLAGSCRKPGHIAQAIADGFAVGCRL